MKYDFIEIGTCDFDTEIHNHNGRIGISVDPIKMYLDNLPDIPNVTKVHAAISNYDGTVPIFVPKFPEFIIKQHPWLRGCVSIIQPHKHVIGFCLHNNLLPLESYMYQEQTNVLSVATFVQKYNINEVDYLKIDTEGHDYVIVNAWLDEVEKNNTSLPKKIFYESKDLSDQNELLKLRERLTNKGYKLIFHGQDTEAILVLNEFTYY
jgi:hypothetical protein